MHYLVYKTINTVNGKYYIGAHKTSNLNDGYMGSGKLLNEAFSKYGKDKFSREILQFCSSEEEMFSIEKSLIDHTDRNNYNLVAGGLGGCKIAPDKLHEHLTIAREKAHKSKLESGYYKRLGKINAEKIRGSKKPEQGKKFKLYCEAHPMLWWTNGIKVTRSDVCPGEGWVRGRK